MFANFATAVPAGATMTLLILFAMHSLIAMQPFTTTERTTHDLGVFLLQPRDEELRLMDFDPGSIEEVEPTPLLRPIQDQAQEGSSFSIPAGQPLPRETTEYRWNPGTQDGPLVAVVRVQPTYPAGPASRGLEGFVTVMFDVFPDVSVGNISVVDSSSRLFERSAINAASRFRFKALVANGEPQMSTGIQYRFTFEMNK